MTTTARLWIIYDPTNKIVMGNDMPDEIKAASIDVDILADYEDLEKVVSQISDLLLRQVAL